jgi:hypothetical protein
MINSHAGVTVMTLPAKTDTQQLSNNAPLLDF